MIKQIVITLSMLGISALAYSQDYKKIHQDFIVVDAHNDVIIESILTGKDISKRLRTGHTDIPRLKEGGVDVQVFAVWSDDKKYPVGKAFAHANAQIDALEAVLAKNKASIGLAKNSSDIENLIADGKIAALIGIEGGNMIEGSIDKLQQLYDRGARYLTLTWNYNLPWATAAALEVKSSSHKNKGLSDHGKDIIRAMNAMGMMIDLSHAGEQTFYDVLALSTKPVLVSHSNAYALTPHYRNLKDEQLSALKKNGGVVGVNFYSAFLDADFDKKVVQLYQKHFNEKSQLSPSKQFNKLPAHLKKQVDAPLSTVVAHINYLVQKVGIDHVAIGSDFDGINSAPQGLQDAAQFPTLTAALLKEGYSQQEVAKIMGLNFLRILKEHE